MNKFYSMLTIAAAAVALAAPASGAPAPSPDLLKPVKLAADAQRMVQADIPAPKRAAAKTADEQWSAWEQIGTASFDQDLIDMWTRQCGWLGTSMPEFTQPFAIEGRLSQSDETKGELRLRNIFGGVDIVLPYDTRTGYFDPEPQSTAIPLNTPGYYDNIMLSVRGYYYPAARKIDFNSVFFLIFDTTGYNCGSSALVMDGAPEVKFLLGTSHFIPSTATSLTVNVDRSSNVAWYRVVSIENSMTSDDLSAYFAKEPVHTPNVYTDYTGDSFTLSPWGMSAIWSRYFVIPFGADDRVIGSYEVVDVDYNYNFHNGYNAEWTSLGRGRMIEDAVYYGYNNDAYNESIVDGVPVKTPFTSTPELEMTTDGSLLCVKNPFGPEHPAYSKLIENYPEAKSDDFYMVFDISDPSRVQICEALSGLVSLTKTQMPFGSIAGNLLSEGKSSEEIDSLEVCLWGKFADNRVTIPRNSATIGYNSSRYDFEITVELPGYVDYDIKAEPAVTSDGTAYNCLLNNVSPNIVSVDYALVPESYYLENRNFPERIPAAFAEASGGSRVRKSAANGFSVRNAATNGASTLTLSIPEEEVGYGNWVLAAVGRDANGNTHSALFVPQVVSKTRPLSEWRNAGTVKVCDGIVGSIYQSKPTVFLNVELLENPDVEGVYLLPNYYNMAFASLGVNGTFDSEIADPFVLDLRGDYPLLTNSLSGARCTGEMMTGIEIPVNEESTWQLRVMNTCDLYAGNYGSITRGDDGSIEKVDFSNTGVVVMIYESHSGEQLGSMNPGKTWIDFTYDVATDPYIFDNWRPVGTVTVTENIVSDVVAEGSESSCEAEIFAHPTEAGIYCVPEPLGGMKWTGVCDSYVNTSAYPFVINATDPYNVFVARDLNGQRTGDIFWFTGWWLTADTPIYLCLLANAIESGALQGDGWSVDSVLGTYDAEAAEFNLDRCFMTSTDGSSLQGHASPKFRVRFNTSSVDEAAVSAAGVVSVEYYTVDGRRLASPADGITIRRTLYSDGRTTTDKLLR